MLGIVYVWTCSCSSDKKIVQCHLILIKLKAVLDVLLESYLLLLLLFFFGGGALTGKFKDSYNQTRLFVDMYQLVSPKNNITILLQTAIRTVVGTPKRTKLWTHGHPGSYTK